MKNCELLMAYPLPLAGEGGERDSVETRSPGEGVEYKNIAQFPFHPHPQPLSRQRERGEARPSRVAYLSLGRGQIFTENLGEGKTA